MSDFLRIVQQRAVKSGEPVLLQVGFDVAVLEQYRSDARYRVMRTATVGRVQQDRGWSLDFGISPGEATVHASWGALMTVVPEEERDHWASHAASVETYSEMFLRMQLSPSSCFDDGELMPW